MNLSPNNKASFANVINLSSNQKALIAFVGLSLLMRFFSFFPSVIDHDESTYLVIANEMLQHETLYIDLIDIKPPGIFLIYALQLLICKSIFFTRFVTALVVAVTAYCLYLHKMKKNEHDDIYKIALSTGFLYIVLCSVFTLYGVSPNTELYFNLFTALGLVLFSKQNAIYYFFGGLMMGIGFIIKYMVLFDFTAFMLFNVVLLWLTYPTRYNVFRQILRRVLLAFIGLLLPFVACHVYYYLSNNFDAYYFITYIAPKNYVDEWKPLHMIQLVGDYYLRFLPISFFFFYTLVASKYNSERTFATIWTILAIVAVVLPGNRFGHYTIQLMLPTAWLAGSFFTNNLIRPKWVNTILQKKIGYPLLILFILISCYLQKKECYDKPDISQQTADYLNAHLKPKQTIYTGNAQQIIYLLTNQNSPIPYVHRSLLFSKTHINAIKIDTTAQINKIIAFNPTYILQQDTLSNQQLWQFVQNNYVLDQTIGNKIQVFKNKNAN